MYIINQAERNAFLAGIPKMFDVYTRTFPDRSIENFDDILFAATRLYAYGTPFANPRSGTQPHYLKADIPHLEELLWSLVDMVYDYFNGTPYTKNTQGNFDQFQERLCDTFLDIFAEDGVYEHTYGNAQKMVNMLFKYLTCFEDYDYFADLFSYCHIPIDRKILQKLYNYHVPNATRSGTYKDIDSTTGSIVETPWTSMTKEQYSTLLNAYRTTLAPVKGLNSWLGIEYRLWADQPIHTVGMNAPIISAFKM